MVDVPGSVDDVRGINPNSVARYFEEVFVSLALITIRNLSNLRLPLLEHLFKWKICLGYVKEMDASTKFET